MYVNLDNLSTTIDRAIYEDDNSECPICLDNLSQTDIWVAITNCGHVFHKKCLTDSIGYFCPFCTTPYNKKNVCRLFIESQSTHIDQDANHDANDKQR